METGIIFVFTVMIYGVIISAKFLKEPPDQFKEVIALKLGAGMACALCAAVLLFVPLRLNVSMSVSESIATLAAMIASISFLVSAKKQMMN